MTRPGDLLHVLDNPAAPPLQIDDADGALLLQLVVHIFFADEVLHDGEVELLSRLIGGAGPDELRRRIAELGSREMSFQELADRFPDHQDRLDIITLAEHAWWADHQLEPGEMDIADKLADAFQIYER